MTVASLFLAVALVAALMFGAGDGYRVTIELPNAGQLVTGNEVKLGGVPVGMVEEIELTDHARARIELSIEDDDLTPLRRGTVATVRASSLSGIANRYVALQLGPNDAPAIEDGGVIRAEDTRATVDLDQVLNSLDPATQADLRAATRLSADVFDEGAAEDIDAALTYLNPALSQSAATARELAADQRALERFVVESADVASAVASRPADLQELVANALAATGDLAAESRALESSLRRLPPVLRRTNTTLVNVRALLEDLRPAIDEARPAAPELARVLTRLQPIARAAVPEARALRRTIDRRGRADDLLGVLRRLTELDDAAVPAFDSAVQTVEDALPVVRDARPYTPDLIAGLNGFGGATSGYYDANGRYTRISAQGNPYSLNDEGALFAPPDGPEGLFGYRKGLFSRCPGAGSWKLPDGSNPFTDGRDDLCKREHSPR